MHVTVLVYLMHVTVLLVLVLVLDMKVLDVLKYFLKK